MLEMLTATMTQIFDSYSRFAGNGMYMLLFFISLIYIYISNTKNDYCALLSYYSILMLALIYNPFIAKFIMSFIDDYVYWRVFWMLPIPIVIAFSAASIIDGVPEKFERVIVTISLIAIVIISGKLIFVSENFTTSSNLYKLPQETIEICDILELDCSGDIRLVVPAELETTIRQYNANIFMLYGRDGGLYSKYIESYERSMVFKLMHAEELNVEATSTLMKIMNFNYLVLDRKKPLSEPMGTYGYHCIETTATYNIYRLDPI